MGRERSEVKKELNPEKIYKEDPSKLTFLKK